MTIGGQQDKEEDTVAAVTIGQIPAAQQLHGHIPGHGAKVRGLRERDTREGTTDGLEITVTRDNKKSLLR